MQRTSRRTILAGLGVTAVTLTFAGHGGRAKQGGNEEHHIYFGWLLGTAELAAVAFDVGALNDAGARDVRAYVCDGLGPPSGMAVWFKASIIEETVNRRGGSGNLGSASGQENLEIDHLDEHGVSGAFTGADGQTRRFAAFPATDGAGIYDVTLDENLHYTGNSTDGATLDAQSDEDGLVEGTITTADGEAIEFSVQTLALATAADLTERGLPSTFTEFADNNLVPGTYVALLSPGGHYWLGRSGDIRGGSAGSNIIGLDMAC